MLRGFPYEYRQILSGTRQKNDESSSDSAVVLRVYNATLARDRSFATIPYCKEALSSLHQGTKPSTLTHPRIKLVYTINRREMRLVDQEVQSGPFHEWTNSQTAEKRKGPSNSQLRPPSLGRAHSGGTFVA